MDPAGDLSFLIIYIVILHGITCFHSHIIGIITHFLLKGNSEPINTSNWDLSHNLFVGRGYDPALRSTTNLCDKLKFTLRGQEMGAVSRALFCQSSVSPLSR